MVVKGKKNLKQLNAAFNESKIKREMFNQKFGVPNLREEAPDCLNTFKMPLFDKKVLIA